MDQNAGIQKMRSYYVEINDLSSNEYAKFRKGFEVKVKNVDKQKIKSYMAQGYFIIIVVLTLILLY